jgi:hypothetical protein
VQQNPVACTTRRHVFTVHVGHEYATVHSPGPHAGCAPCVHDPGAPLLLLAAPFWHPFGTHV